MPYNPIRSSLNKAFLKVKPSRSQIEDFKINLSRLLDHINVKESEEFHKNLIAEFLKRTYYGTDWAINTKERTDLVIHLGKNAKSNVGVLIEAKSPVNKTEMPGKDKLNTKAFQELLLYYLRERITNENLEIKHLLITNIHEWFVFDSQQFERYFASNKKLINQFGEFEEKRLSGVKTDFFYKDIAAQAIEAVKDQLEFTWFDLSTYIKPLKNENPKDDNKLIALFKIFSPEHLLKLPFANDSNSLNRTFYTELLHLIGLTEEKGKGKKIIQRLTAEKRNPASLLENTINQLEARDYVSRLENPNQYGDNREERLFNVGLELVITWINRILFLKLLEAQLLSYHKGNPAFGFLNSKLLHDYDDVDALFFQVLACKVEERSGEAAEKFNNVPYLNSSLFEPMELEYNTMFIGSLRNDLELPLPGTTVLKNNAGKRQTGKKETLQYLFDFLGAYDFSSEGGEEIQEENKTLINASVLGLIFEKINGYRDGSFFTPGFITMYMCRETIRRAVLQKFSEASSGSAYQTIPELHDAINRDFSKEEANKIINSLKICDPAVGSGHFLVSALNEIIALKSELRILQDADGKTLRDYDITIENDELIITDDDGKLFEYHHGSKESQRVQETLFHEKQTIIENCLFGVDINPNSVKICRLRLWIELLKNAYYKQDDPSGLKSLETLPNIDINIKCGNSLISRFALDADLKKALKKSKWSIEGYKAAVQTYHHAESKDQKREMERLIARIKSDFRSEINANDPKAKRLRKVEGEVTILLTQKQLFPMSKKEKAAFNQQMKKLSDEASKLRIHIEEIKNNTIYDNAFEWRFEFPEVLNADGDFMGFDVVIGNPPYIRQEALQEFKAYFKGNFSLYTGTSDIYVFFIEKGFDVLKPRGVFTYIMPNKFMQAGYGKPARKFLLEHNLLEIIDFGDLQVFDEATTYPCILTASKENPGQYFTSVAVETLDFKNDFVHYTKSIGGDFEQRKMTDETWVVSNSADQILLEKIKAVSNKLDAYLIGEANYGVKPGFSEAFFIDDEAKKVIAGKDPKSEELLRPLLRGRNVTPWFSEANGNCLIATFPSLRLDIDDYPGIKDHLLSFGKKRLEQTGEKGSRKKTSGKWFETQDSIGYWKEFEKPKIMYQKFQVKPCFIYDEEGLFCNDSMWIIPTDDKVLLGILNSKLGWWLISKYCTAIQNGYQLIWKYFSQIPIAHGSPEQRTEITGRVNEILRAKKEDPTADIKALEAEVDELVYELYGLTKEEREIVENLKG